MGEHRIYLFVHLILPVQGGKQLLKPSLRAVYIAWLKKTSAEKGIRILQAGGGMDHMHMLLQLHPAQNFLQVVKQIREESTRFINESGFLQEPFAWEAEHTAFSVSPSAFNQTMDYIAKQDEYHQAKTFAQEMEIIHKITISTDEA